MFTEWYERLKEIRELKGYEPKKFSEETEIPYTVLNRYEKGKGAEVLSGRLKIKLRRSLTEEEIEYIENGKNKPDVSQNGTENNQIVGNGNSIGSCTQKDSKIVAECLPADILSVVEMMQELDKTKRRKVLRFVLDLE